jgi:Mg-chelatase subunit ChlD
VLAIDTSGSMSGRTSTDGPTKLEAARQAAKDFAANLVAGRDQAAVIQFNIVAEVLVPLTDDIDAVQDGLDQLTQDAGTRIDLAIAEAHLQLTGPSRRQGNNPVIILLTDGEPTHTTPDAVRDAAQRAKDDKLLVFTIGLGTDVDEQLLEDIAGKPTWYFPAPDTSDLQSIYEQIAYEIPCEPVWP